LDLKGSYFYQNGGTQDVTYGQEAAISLAQSDPDSAITNADNYEVSFLNLVCLDSDSLLILCYQYFAENTPTLP
jgi:hypothetical protein